MVLCDWVLALQTGGRLSKPHITNRRDVSHMECKNKKVTVFVAKLCFKIKSPICQHWMRQESWVSVYTHCGKPPIVLKTLTFTNWCKSAGEYITKCFKKAASWTQTVERSVFHSAYESATEKWLRKKQAHGSVLLGNVCSRGNTTSFSRLSPSGNEHQANVRAAFHDSAFMC